MKIDVLDSGYVEFIEAWGTGKEGDDYEVGIIEAARQSTQGSFRGWDTDSKLLKYLYDHKHATPTEFSGMIVEVKAPIFVFREWHRHRVQSFNESSARYSALPNENYIPTKERLLVKASGNKQASTVAGAPKLTEEGATDTIGQLNSIYESLETMYQHFLTSGVPKELARIILPVGRYSKMRAQANLRNWLAFIKLRSAPDAQWEIQEYSRAIETILQEKFPRTMEIYYGS